MTQWNPIETAPKDGTIILVWDGAHVSLCEWSYSFRDDNGEVRQHWVDTLPPDQYAPLTLAEVGHWYCVAAGENACDGGHDSHVLGVEKPTHWMPVPAPPPG